ncbi:MAG: hypothetical protein E3J30_00455 [Anaerolineales bacterium]|nr:MAG: hypothetical protein E3J30_00455 [Anaerolineales bacterium]
MSRLEHLTPAASKPWLIASAGIMWSGVGLMLCSLAYGWLLPVAFPQVLWMAFAGILLASTIYHFGFSKLAEKNIQRITDIAGDKICIFAFQEWTSYPIVAVMIGLGISLRNFLPIPKPYLAILYIGIGGGLFLSSMCYYKYLLRPNQQR